MPLFEMRYGDQSTPKAEWEINESGITDPKAGQARVKLLNAQRIEIDKRYDDALAAYRAARAAPEPTYNDPTPTGRYNFDWDGDHIYSTSSVFGTRSAHRPSFYDEPLKPFNYGWRYTLRKVSVECDFLAREAARTDEPIRFPDEIKEQYLALCTCAEVIPPNMVSFYRSFEDAYDNKRTTMKLGRFMKDYFYNMDDNQIAAMVAKMGIEFGDATFKIATTREEIRMVYMEGPTSCMDSRHFRNVDDDNPHPCEAYASGELGVAYLERGGDVTTRAVVNLTRKQYNTIYGDSVRMEAMFEKEGFTQSGDTLAGAKLALIRHTSQVNRVAMPYLDGRHTQCEVHQDHLRIIAQPQIVSSTQDGSVYIDL